MAKIILSKTFFDADPFKLDERTNNFRKNNRAIATSCDSVMNQGTIIFIQTVFYSEE